MAIFDSFCFEYIQIEELNGTIQSYRTTISEKEAKLNELQSKLENAAVDQREQELFKQIADYKEKNNVSKYQSKLMNYNHFFIFVFCMA